MYSKKSKPKEAAGIKSIDFCWKMNIDGIEYNCYASHKHTNEAGGSQDNQFNDLMEFASNANQNTDTSCLFFAIADGKYYQKSKDGFKTKIDYANSLYQTARFRFITSDELADIYNK